MNLTFFLILINFVAFSTSYECGKVRIGLGFIGGGVESRKGEWPWLAPLFKRSGDIFFCSSSIISRKHLLGGE